MHGQKNIKFLKFVISEILVIQTVKIADVCNVMPKGPVGTYRCLRGTNCLLCLL